MAISKKMKHEMLREKYMNLLVEFFTNYGEDVQIVESNQIAFPVVDCEDCEENIKITVTVPLGANKGTEPYNCYDAADDYKFRCAEKKRKAEEKAKEKEAKKKRDEEIRKKKEEQKNKG